MEFNKNMKSIIEESFIQYSGAVLQSRALVDVRDCIKPSARQIFYCLYTDKFLPSKPFKKTLKATGSASRVYIHGDASAEGVIMRAGQHFAMRYPLVEVEGNAGNLMSSGNWAAPRYTASRLSPFAVKMFESVNKNTIDEWRDNYDDTEKYPTVLPSKGFYNIVNGTFGIGIGASSSIPQFNIKDINNALITLLKKPDASFEDLYCPVDFATGGILINENEVKEALKEGHGASCKLRAKIEYDSKDNTLTAVEIPYGVYTNTICKELEAIVESEDNPGIERFNDLTGVKPMLKIYLTKNANTNKVLNYLWKHTSLQSYFGINFTMLKDGRFPQTFTWKETLQEHINHEVSVYRKEFEFDLAKIQHQIMINYGLLKCLEDIDNVVKMIKTSESPSIAKEKLIAALEINEEQANAILKMTLSRLAHLEVEKLKADTKKLEEEANHIINILNNTDLFNSYLIKGWEDTAKKYGDEHRTQNTNLIENNDEDKEIENITPEEMVIIMSKSGKIKRIPKDSFKIQRRNTKGIKNSDDTILETISTNTIDTLMFFTSKGKMYKTLVDNIPIGDNKKAGVDISAFIPLEADEKVIAVTSLYRKSQPKYVCFITKQGMIKKTELKEYMSVRKNTGIAAIKLKEKDSIANITFINNEDLILVSKGGYAIRFETENIAPIGRVAMGVKSIKLSEGDEVLIGLPVHNENDNLAIFVTGGYGKKISLSELPTQGRNGKGLIIYKSIDENSTVVSAAMVEDTDSLLILGKPNSICISASEIPLLNRLAIGNIMIKNSKILKVQKL